MEQPKQPMKLGSDQDEMLIRAAAAGFEPVDFEELVEELRGALLQVVELPPSSSSSRTSGCSASTATDQQSGFVMRELSAFIRSFRQALGAIHIHRRRGTRERTKESAREQRREPGAE